MSAERLEVVRARAFSSGSAVESKERLEERERCSLEFGGTSWTWRLRGWFDFAGGGRTTIKDLAKEKIDSESIKVIRNMI